MSTGEIAYLCLAGGAAVLFMIVIAYCSHDSTGDSQNR